MSFLKRHILLLSTLTGAVIGYVILHPFGMMIHVFFHLHRKEGYLHLHWDEIRETLAAAFSFGHLPQSVSYIILTGIIGYLVGELVKSYQAREKISQKLALIDELTGLYNRRGFFSFSTQLMKLSDRTKKGLVLIYIDLNNLKYLNDQHGHAEGDKMLACVADVLKNTFRGSDIVGRIGGDEFSVLAIEAERESIDIMRKRLNIAVNKAECKKRLKCDISLSIGLVYYNPEQPCPIEELVHRADILMYEEKKFLKSAK